ncbi:MAG: LysR family transcriptional regulator [Alphaproteobacteria bacterium HGW-Alphaproteobacteria-18]|nr:MAG: LysR family transcriptional regulator [Alphaproteobacteria bacterium HGW-Alphaproteobacteria-18]
MTARSKIPPRLNVPLNALKAFEAAARLLSIKDAALELGVTPSAVSHQLKILEDALGVDLMRRTGARIELTEPGASLSPALTEGFTRISSAVTGISGDRQTGPLRLSVLPTFAHHWFSPRLKDYPFDRPGCELQISSSQTAVDLAAGEADAGIRHGRGAWRGLQADLLFTQTVTLLASPALASSAEPRALIARSNLFLSQHLQASWDEWNQTLPGGPVQPGALTRVDSAGLGLKAALDGAGITLAGWEVCRADIDAGRLVPLFEHRTDAGSGYWLVYPEALARDRRIRNLRGWLIAATRSPSPEAPKRNGTAARA